MSIDLNNVEIVEDEVVVNDEVVSDTPNITSPQWTNYVLSLLTDEEKTDGHPKVHGLRRIVETLLGEIVSSKPTFVAGPTGSTAEKLVASVIYEISILSTRGIVTYGGAADAGSHSLDFPYSQYPTAIAETRAEGRALRKALRLNVIAAEELSTNSNLSEGSSPPIVDGAIGYINAQQINFINMMAKRLDINVKRFVNTNINKGYSAINGVLYEEAISLIKQLQEYQGNVASIPEDLKGYSGNFE